MDLEALQVSSSESVLSSLWVWKMYPPIWLHFVWQSLATLGNLWRVLAKSLVFQLFLWASHFSVLVGPILSLTEVLGLLVGSSPGIGWILSRTFPRLPLSLSLTETCCSCLSNSRFFGLKSDVLVPSLSLAGFVFWASRFSLFFSPTLCFTGVFLTVSLITTLLGGVCWAFSCSTSSLTTAGFFSMLQKKCGQKTYCARLRECSCLRSNASVNTVNVSKEFQGNMTVIIPMHLPPPSRSLCTPWKSYILRWLLRYLRNVRAYSTIRTYVC